MSDSELRLLVEVRRAVTTGEARRLRQDAQLAIAEIARAANTSAAAVSRWESGDRVPRGEAALRYGRVLRRLRAQATRASKAAG